MIVALGVAVALGGGAVAGHGIPARVTGSAPALPSSVGRPWLWTPTVTQSPPGSASLIFGGSSPLLNGLSSDDDTIAVVGSAYRRQVIENGGAAGDNVLLSADGTRMAYTDIALDRDTAGIRVLDLRTGTVTRLADPARTADEFAPAAWSPDGRRFVVYRDVSGARELGVFDGTSYRRLAGYGDDAPPDPYLAAFSPDGSRIAYQVDDHVTIAGADGSTIASYPLPAHAYLAGKGAWLPDGRSVAYVGPDRDTWTITVLDAATGKPAGTALAPVHDVSALRLLGWRDATHAVAVGYRRSWPSSYAPDGDITAYDRVGGVRILVTGPDTTALVTDLPGSALSVDVASNALSTPGPASRAPILPMPSGWAAAFILIGYAACAVLGTVVVALVRRSRRSRPA
jgi:hypothetical protein